MLKAGIFLGKRYEILGHIGSGGMADVYKGRDHKLDRLVAIKVLKSDFRTDQVFVRNFLREAQAAAGLMHPNIVNVYDVGQDRGLYYMVMELVEGITLKEYIEKKRRLSAKETINISIQMTMGIQAAHSKHIIHRDIKPQNIIISKDGKVKVTDFGIARATTSTKTISAGVMGSVHYTSPEQARGGKVDEKSDIYSAGITMYEMITGHVPFDGDSTVSVAIKHLQENMVSPAEEVPDIPYSLECIILKCTQKDPYRRYQSCSALLLDLKHSLVEPEGNFVNIQPSRGGYIVPAEPGAIGPSNMGPGRNRRYQPRDYDEDYGDDYDDGDDDYRTGRGRQSSRRKDDVDTGMKKIMKILMIVVAAIIAFMAIFMAAKALGIFGTRPDKIHEEPEERLIKVPDVVGRSLKDAEDALKKKHLGIHIVRRENSDKFREGIILQQEPGENEKVNRNTEIRVVVSLGKEKVKVKIEDVIGKSEEEAQKILNDQKLVVDFKSEFHDVMEKGKVIRTQPLPSAEVAEGSQVIIIVSKGPEKVKVPDIIGYKKDDAEKRLKDFHLKLGEVKEEYSTEYEPGMVIFQKPQKDEKVKPDTPVDIVLSKGRQTQMAVVPYLVGKKERVAIDKLLEAGLTPNIIYEADAEVIKGYVISQSAPGGSELEKGTFVDVVVSSGYDDPYGDEPYGDEPPYDDDPYGDGPYGWR